MTDPTTATVKLRTLNAPSPAVPGGELAAPTRELLKAAVAYELVTLALQPDTSAALAFIEAQLTSGAWDIIDIVKPFTRTPVKA